METLREFRRYLRKKHFGSLTKSTLWMILSIALISSSHGLSRTPLEKDIDDILFFDNGIKKGKTMAIPQIRTSEGEQLWRQYIKLYQAERGPI